MDLEIRAFAERVLCSGDLQVKISRTDAVLTDSHPGAAVRIRMPARSADLQFAPRRTAPTMPRKPALGDEKKRAIAHHIMANHELQALEVMAMVVLAFPAAPAEFRMGLSRIMQDEQRHTRMHVQRCQELGLRFGELPVNGWIWTKAQEYQSPLEYVAGLPLVFEGANLDHSAELEQSFLNAGDRRSAAIMRAIHKDEIHHVEFGLTWLRRWKPKEMSDWDAWSAALHWPIRPEKARGAEFQRDARLMAGMDEDFIRRLQALK